MKRAENVALKTGDIPMAVQEENAQKLTPIPKHHLYRQVQAEVFIMRIVEVSGDPKVH